jgi:hypothetical protein
MAENKTVYEALQAFAASVTAKMSQPTHGEPEEQLRGPFENFVADVSSVLNIKIVCTGETLLKERIGRPDFAVHNSGLLSGFVELKPPGTGADATRFKGHNREQWNRFTAIPNILYSDGNDWALYRSGVLAGNIVRVSGDIAKAGKKAVSEKDAPAIEALLRSFFAWQPVIPFDREGNVDLKGFAKVLAPLCWMLREAVTETIADPASPLVQLAHDWRQLLFPEADDKQFADSYAQTVTFALLLGRSEGAHPLTLNSAEAALSAQHSLLSRALQVLTDPSAQAPIQAALDLLIRIIAVVPAAKLTGPHDPWLYFYEDFLEAYDPKLRKDAGAYYTPVEVVHAQVRMIDDLLTLRLHKPLGFADPGVVTLDPAVGTGTYLLGVIEHALGRIEAEQGRGAVPGQATALANNLYGFEIMVGPYAVSELRISRALRDHQAALPKTGSHVYLTDTLESPHAVPPQLPLFLKAISEQHELALQVKSNVPVIVCLGNPPYDRHEAATEDNKSRTGAWVRWADDGKGTGAILRSFLDPAIAAGHGGDIKNLYNLYVYFWRWALWKVFEHETASGPGVVSFISASSYIDGDAFSGMREHMRRECDEIWILDLGGEGRGTRQSDNVFAIQTPVAIAVAMRAGKADKDKPASVHYFPIEGSRDDKLLALDAITSTGSIKWRECPGGWLAPFRPAGKGLYFDWPLLTDLMPWQQSGVKAGRTWVISSDAMVLKQRWQVLCNTAITDRKALFKDSPTGRKVHERAKQLAPHNEELPPITELPKESVSPAIQRYAYRSFDCQFIFADARLIDRPGPALWRAHSARQAYLTTAFTQAIGAGPSVTACSEIPDLHYYSGRGAKDIVPLYRTAGATEANILPGLLDLLSQTYSHAVTPEDFLAYVYGILAQPAFTARYRKELESCELRVPLTLDAELFENVRFIGARLLWLHTYGERYVPAGRQRGHIPPGAAKCEKPVPGDADNYPEAFAYDSSTLTLTVGAGEFKPVAPEVYTFEVSGLKPVQSWLKYRMRNGAGKKSSPLDDIRPEKWSSQFTTELLELLWVLEATVEGYPEQAKLLEAIVAGSCIKAADLPPVPADMRKPPRVKAAGAKLFDEDSDDSD